MELLEYQKRYHRMVLHPQENGLTPIEEDQQTSHLQRILSHSQEMLTLHQGEQVNTTDEGSAEVHFLEIHLRMTE